VISLRMPPAHHVARNGGTEGSEPKGIRDAADPDRAIPVSPPVGSIRSAFGLRSDRRNLQPWRWESARPRPGRGRRLGDPGPTGPTQADDPKVGPGANDVTCFGVIDRRIGEPPCARRCVGPHARNVAVGSCPADRPFTFGFLGPARLIHTAFSPKALA
jgi:hypothetical protein